MKFLCLNGKTKSIKGAHNYAIDWNGKSRSDLQFKVKKCLEPLWSGMSVYEEFPLLGFKRALTFDFYNYNLNIAIEVQGHQHVKHVEYFHGKNKLTFYDQLNRDRQKREYCTLNNIKLIEVFYNDKISTAFLEGVL